MEQKNAIIEDATLCIERGLLTAYIYLDYGGSGQSFGGYALYLNTDFDNSKDQKNITGHFIYRVLQVAGVEKWKDLKGKTVRVIAEHSKCHSIGHIVKDDWFDPVEEFESIMKE